MPSAALGGIRGAKTQPQSSLVVEWTGRNSLGSRIRIVLNIQGQGEALGA